MVTHNHESTVHELHLHSEFFYLTHGLDVILQLRVVPTFNRFGQQCSSSMKKQQRKSACPTVREVPYLDAVVLLHCCLRRCSDVHV